MEWISDVYVAFILTVTLMAILLPLVFPRREDMGLKAIKLLFGSSGVYGAFVLIVYLVT